MPRTTTADVHAACTMYAHGWSLPVRKTMLALQKCLISREGVNFHNRGTHPKATKRYALNRDILITSPSDVRLLAKGKLVAIRLRAK